MLMVPNPSLSLTCHMTLGFSQRLRLSQYSRQQVMVMLTYHTDGRNSRFIDHKTLHDAWMKVLVFSSLVLSCGHKTQLCFFLSFETTLSKKPPHVLNQLLALTAYRGDCFVSSGNKIDPPYPYLSISLFSLTLVLPLSKCLLLHVGTFVTAHALKSLHPSSLVFLLL